MTGVAALRVLSGTAFLGLGAVVIYYAIIFDGPFPDHPVLRGHNDLALHVAAFLALSTSLLVLRDSQQKTIAGLILFAGSIEIVQVFQPHRTADWVDFAGSVTGVALASLLAGGLRWFGALLAARETDCDE